MKVLAGDESTPSRKRRRLELVANDAYDTYCKAFKEYEEAMYTVRKKRMA